MFKIMLSIYHDVYIDTSPQVIFDAIANPNLMIHRWPLSCKGEMELGGIYNFYFSPDYDWYGKISRLEQNVVFHIKMTYSDEDWDPTTFGYELKAVGGGSRVAFFHEGWPACNHHYRRSSYRWAIRLKGLKYYIEKGVIVSFEDRG